MWRAGEAAFVDVLPQAPRPKNLPADVVWRDKPRFDIPGSLWLPDTGYGELAPVMLDYFRRGLDKALGGRPPAASRVLLPQGLLDVLERRQARDRARLRECRLVPGGFGWLGRHRPAGREARARAAAVSWPASAGWKHRRLPAVRNRSPIQLPAGGDRDDRRFFETISLEKTEAMVLCPDCRKTSEAPFWRSLSRGIRQRQKIYLESL